MPRNALQASKLEQLEYEASSRSPRGVLGRASPLLKSEHPKPNVKSPCVVLYVHLAAKNELLRYRNQTSQVHGDPRIIGLEPRILHRVSHLGELN